MTDPTRRDEPIERPSPATPKRKVTRARVTAVGGPPEAPKPGASTRPAKVGDVGPAATRRAATGAATSTATVPGATKPSAPNAEAAAGVVVVPLAGASSPRRRTTAHGDVDVDVLNLTGGGINNARANQIDVRQGGIGRVQATDVAVSMGGIGIARGDRVSAEMSGVGIALAGDARVSQSFVRSLFARDVRLDQSAVWSVFGGHVTFERRSIAGVVIARRVEGDVKPLLDWRGALAFAGIVSVVLAMVRRR
jgi:hypothetical protein